MRDENWSGLLITFALLAMLSLGVGIGLYSAGVYERDRFKGMSAEQIEVDLMWYQGRLKSSGMLRCDMSIEDWRRYFALKEELISRGTVQ